jgi:hypothetical protein
MPSLTIEIGSHGQRWTINQMRIRLAQMLAGLNGDQEITFSFVGTMPEYRPAIMEHNPWVDGLRADDFKPESSHTTLIDLIARESHGRLSSIVFGVQREVPQESVPLEPTSNE